MSTALTVQQSPIGELFTATTPRWVPYLVRLRNEGRKSVTLVRLTVDGPVYRFNDVRYHVPLHQIPVAWPQRGVSISPGETILVSAQLAFSQAFNGWGYVTPYLQLNGDRIEPLTPMEFSSEQSGHHAWVPLVQVSRGE
jgi:hypothetical protein